MELYEQGLSDGAIAKKLNCSIRYIFDLRTEAGLPANVQDPIYSGFQVLYDLGYCDDHIAAEKRCTATYVGCWRQRHGYPPNPDLEWRRTKEKKRLICRDCAYYYQSMSVEFAMCDYLGTTGHRRGCPPPSKARNYCEKFKSVKKSKKK